MLWNVEGIEALMKKTSDTELFGYHDILLLIETLQTKSCTVLGY